MEKRGIKKAKKPPTIAELNRLTKELQSVTVRLESREREFLQAQEQQAATSEILRVISSAPTDLHRILNVIASDAARLSGSYDAMIRLVEGNVLRIVAHHGPVPEAVAERPLDLNSASGRAVVERKVIHIEDLLALAPTEFPDAQADHQRLGLRTVLHVPLMREVSPIGVISIRRTEVLPFSEQQITLLKTFADQAVIAIENARLIRELGRRTAEVEASNVQLTEALEQQTATSEVLNVIARSPVELPPVYQAILANTTRLCEANIAALFLYDGELIHTAASFGTTPEFAAHLEQSRSRPSHETTTRLAALERRTVHVADLLTDADFSPNPARTLSEKENVRTVLSVPMLREDKLVGVITTWRREVRPFSDKQIALVKTFADQAVIAIENVRLFQELKNESVGAADGDE